MTTSSPSLNRRGFLGAALASTPFLGSTLVGQEAAASAPSTFRNPFVYKLNIGELEAYSISDANLILGEGIELMHPVSARDRMLEELTRHGERSQTLPLYVNVLAVRAGKEVALFDAGFGAGNNPQLGWLMDGLRAAGIQPEEVTAAFLSHAHADHLNGFVKDGAPAFPNAPVYALPDEISFWRAPEPDFSKTYRDKGQLPGMIRDVRSRYDALGSHLQAVEDGAELWGGRVRVEAAPGHTSGHACFRIRAGDEELLHLSDLAHHSLLMFTNPEWFIAFDHDPEQSIITRKKYWKDAAAKHTRCYGFHLPWPGLGRIVARNESSYTWWQEPLGWIK